MQALSHSSYIDNYPLPTKTLSVPYQFGNAPTDLAPARLPPSRWAPRSETRLENPSADEASVVTPSEPGGKGPGGVGNIEGDKAPETPPGGAEGAESSSPEGEDAAERKKLALRRRDCEGRSSLSSKKTTKRPQPKIALPMSLRLSDVEARRDSNVGAGRWMISAPPKTPTKVNQSPM